MQRNRLFRTILAVLFALYLFVLLNLLFLGRQVGGYSGLNLQPFYTIRNYLRAWQNDTINKSIVVRNLGGNLLLFAPMAFCLPILFERMRKTFLCLLFIACMIAATEALQYVLHVGSCDIDDFLLNFTGAVAAYPVGRLIAMFCREKKGRESGEKRKNENK